jgi:MarR family transcriptional regulator, lower aerobic nicotinate degradation pathway regulator
VVSRTARLLPTTSTLWSSSVVVMRSPLSLPGERNRWLISRTYARSHALLNDGFAESGTGFRSYHYRLLAALEESGPTTQANLGRNTSIDRSDVVNILAELERRGLIRRNVDPTNRHRNIVTITAAGRKQLRALDYVVDTVQERVLEPLTQTERRQLTRLLRKLTTTG